MRRPSGCRRSTRPSRRAALTTVLGLTALLALWRARPPRRTDMAPLPRTPAPELSVWLVRESPQRRRSAAISSEYELASEGCSPVPDGADGPDEPVRAFRFRNAKPTGDPYRVQLNFPRGRQNRRMIGTDLYGRGASRPCCRPTSSTGAPRTWYSTATTLRSLPLTAGATSTTRSGSRLPTTSLARTRTRPTAEPCRGHAQEKRQNDPSPLCQPKPAAQCWIGSMTFARSISNPADLSKCNTPQLGIVAGPTDNLLGACTPTIRQSFTRRASRLLRERTPCRKAS